MRRLYLTLNGFYSVPAAYKLSISRFHEQTGRNIGNLVFRKGLSSIVKDLASYERLSFAALANNHDICKDAETVIVSCANWLGTSARHEQSNKAMANLLERFSCPVIAFGLGIQAPEGTTRIDLGENTIALAKSLSRRAQLIGCRCELTAETLRRYGITNTFVMGCPSNFINLDLTIDHYHRISIERANSESISCLISEVTQGNASSAGYIRHAFEVLMNTPSKYALQGASLLGITYENSHELPPLYRTALGTLQAGQMINIMRDKALAFSCVDEWLFAARRFDFCYGMRMHGSMVALQAGVPTVILHHDKRTEELARVMNLPRMDIKSFLSRTSHPVSCAYEHFWDSLDGYFQTRRVLASRFLDFLHQNGLDPSPEFLAYCRSVAPD
jgi:hypothetical protein